MREKLPLILLWAGVLLLVSWLAFQYLRKGVPSNTNTPVVDDILSSADQEGFGYKNGKCYEVTRNTITGNTTVTETGISNCYKTRAFLQAMKDEYNSIQNRLASPPNPSDPNDATYRATLQARATEILNLLKQIKGCATLDGFDISTMVCVTNQV